MKQGKFLLIAVTMGAMAASPAMARTAVPTNSRGQTSVLARTSGQGWAHNNHWRHHRHHRSHSRIYLGLGFGYPFGYGYRYYGRYPYGYGYYSGPREVIYQAATTDRSTVVAVQRGLARAGYYRGAIDGVIGYGTRNAIRSYERAHGLRIDGHIDQRLLARMGLA